MWGGEYQHSQFPTPLEFLYLPAMQSTHASVMMP